MGVTRTVTIGPALVDEVDILDYARALIEEHAWRQGERPSDADDSSESGWQQIAAGGLSLHDAIGMACFRLSGEAGSATTPPVPGRSSKDYPTGVSTRAGRSMRERATALVHNHTGGKTDIQFNDAASFVDEVYEVLDQALEEAKSDDID